MPRFQLVLESSASYSQTEFRCYCGMEVVYVIASMKVRSLFSLSLRKDGVHVTCSSHSIQLANVEEVMFLSCGFGGQGQEYVWGVHGSRKEGERDASG